MCGVGGSKPKAPVVQAAPIAPPVAPPIDADQDAKKAGDDARKKRLAALGRSDTILTGGLGVAGPAETGGKKLLGGGQ